MREGSAKCRDCGAIHEWDWCYDEFKSGILTCIRAHHPTLEEIEIEEIEIWMCPCGSPFATVVNGAFGSYVFDHDGDVE